MSHKHIISSVDYEGFIEALARRMKSDPTFKDYDFSASGLRAIMKMLAYHGNQQAFINNMLFNEGYIKTAEMYENVGSRASFLSYTPSSKRAARCYVNITVKVESPTSPSELTIDSRNRFMGTKDGKPYFFSPIAQYTSSEKNSQNEYVFENVELYQGNWAYNNFEVTGTAVDTYALPNKNIDIETLQVEVRPSPSETTSVVYNRWRSAYDLKSDAKLYFIQFNRNGLYEIEFGDGIMSSKPVDGSVVYVRYLVTDGDSANGIGTLDPATSIGGFGNINIEVVSKASSGSDRETTSSIRANAPIAFASGGSAVTSRDYGSIVKEKYPNAMTFSWGGEDNIPPKHGFVMVAVKPHDKETLSSIEKSELEAFIKTRNVGSIFPKVVDADPYRLNVKVKIYWLPTYTSLQESGLKSLVVEGLRKYSKEKLEAFGRELDVGDLNTYITDLESSIRKNVVSVDYERQFKPSKLSPENVTVEFFKDIKPGTVKMTNFQMKAENNVVYEMRDDGNGSLFIYRTSVGSLEALYNDKSVGVVDYTKGEIQLKSILIPVTVDGDYVKVFAESASFDQNVHVGRDVILSINTINIEAQVSA